MKKRLSYEHVKEFIESKGFKLITKEYVNARGKLMCICLKHANKGEQQTSYESIRKGFGCKYCGKEKRAKKMKPSFDYVKNSMADENLILLETEYINSQTPMRYTCENHPNEIQTTLWNAFRQGVRCRFCAIDNRANKKRKSYDSVKEEFEKMGLMLVSKTYKNSESPLFYICLNHQDAGEQKTTRGAVQQGSGCPHCAIEKRTLSYNTVYDFFDKKGLTLLSADYISAHQEIEYICRNIPNVVQVSSYANVYTRDGCCLQCADKARSGENSNFWKGGVSPLHNHIRGRINQWKIDSMKKYGYKCIVTGEDKIVIHHLFSFASILNETMEELKLPIKSKINEYSDYELELIESTCLANHYKYELGVPLSPEVHDEFHIVFGKGDNTPEQFEEFMKSKGIVFDIRDVMAA